MYECGEHMSDVSAVIALMDQVLSEICLHHCPQHKTRDATGHRFWAVPHTDSGQ
jgi:hypothetical protein